MTGATLLDAPIRHPRAALVIAFLLSVALAVGVLRLGVDSNIESMMVEGDADQRAFEAKKDVFGSDEVISVALPYRDALSAEALVQQQRIVARLRAFPEIAELDALVTTDDIVGRRDSLEVERLVPDDAAALGAAELAQIRARVAQNRIWTGLLVSRDRRTAALQIRLEDPEQTGRDRGELVGAIQAAVEAERNGEPFHLAGHPYMKTEIARTMQGDLERFLPVTLLAMTLLVIAAVGSIRLAGILLSNALLAVAWTLGAMGWLGMPITALSNTAPTILFAIATAYLMHLMASYGRAVRVGGSRPEIARRALQDVRRPIALAGFTTFAGFCFVAGSRVPLVRGFGIDLCVGILALLVVTCFVTPAALCLVRPAPVRGILVDAPRVGRALSAMFRFAAGHARSVVFVSLLLLLAAGAIATQLVVDSSGPGAFAEDSRFRRSAAFYREHLSGDVVENVYLTTEAEGFIDPDRLRRMLAFQAEVERFEAIDKTLSIADYVALMNRAFHADDPEEERIPDSAAAVAQFLLLYESSGDADEFDDLIDPHRAEVRIVLHATVLSSRESAALRARIAALAERYFPDESDASSVLSTEILLSKAADALAIEQIRSLAGALLLILVGVGVAFRSWREAALLGLPNGLPVVLSFAAMVIGGVTLRDVTSVIAVTTLGLAVDSTVHLLHTARKKEPREGRIRAVEETLLSTGRPVLVTGVVVVVGFAVLGLSGFRVVSDFGILTAVAILCALGADLVLLPAQLLFRAKAGDAAVRPQASSQRELQPDRILRPVSLPSPKEITFDGFRIRYATDLSEQLDAYRFRYDVFLRHGYIEAQDSPDPMLRDAYDERGVQVVARDTRGAMVGSARFVLPSAMGFQTEQFFEVSDLPADSDRVGEVGRLAISDAGRGGGRGPLLGMIQLIHRGLLANGVTHAIAFMPDGLIASLAAIGCVSSPVETAPPSAATLRHRDTMRGYFRDQTTRAVFFDLRNIKDAVERWGRPR